MLFSKRTFNIWQRAKLGIFQAEPKAYRDPSPQWIQGGTEKHATERDRQDLTKSKKGLKEKGPRSLPRKNWNYKPSIDEFWAALTAK